MEYVKEKDGLTRMMDNQAVFGLVKKLDDNFDQLFPVQIPIAPIAQA